MRIVASLVPDGLMLAGAAAALAGLYLLAGVGWALLAGGLVVAIVGFFLEMSWFSRER